MHVVVLFINIGFYHAARLSAVLNSFNEFGWKLTAIQLTDDTLEHPWGNSKDINIVPIVTLVPSKDKRKEANRLPRITFKEINKHLSELKPNVVFLPGWSFQISILALKWCRHNNIPTVVMSESKYDDKMRFWFKEKIKSFLYVKKFSAALVGSDIHAKYVHALGIPEDRIFTGYDAIDNIYFLNKSNIARKDKQEIRRQFSKIPNRPYFLCVLRLIPRKNVKRMIEAYFHYRQTIDGEKWDLVICGEGEEKGKLMQFVLDRELNNFIHFPGFISYNEIGYWYGLASAFIHPAFNEQWGLVVNEACAAGLPLICSKTIGSRYDLVKENINGFLFDPYNIEDISKCLVRMHLTPLKKRVKMGIESNKIVESCSTNTFAQGFIKAIQSIT